MPEGFREISRFDRLQTPHCSFVTESFREIKDVPQLAVTVLGIFQFRHDLTKVFRSSTHWTVLQDFEKGGGVGLGGGWERETQRQTDRQRQTET